MAYSLRMMPNGEVVEVPDNITPDGLKRIENSYRRQARRDARNAQPAPTEEEREVQSRVARRAKLGISSGDSFMDRVNNSLMFGFGDELEGGVSAATTGVYNAVRRGDVGEIGKEYRISRNTSRAEQQQYENENPGKALAGDVLGAVVNPVGTGAGGVRAVAAGASKVGATRTARVAQGLARQMTAGPVRAGISAGVTQGALQAAGEADELSDVPGAMVRGGALGGVMGGALGAGVNAGRRVVQTISDARPQNAARTAAMRMAETLDNSGLTPEQVRSGIARADATGGDAMVMDASPALRAQAAHISRRPNVPNSNEMIERAEARISDRNSRFGQNVTSRVPDMPRVDAATQRAGIEGTRRQAGQQDYAQGGAMDDAVQWTDEMNAWMREAPPITERAMRSGYEDMLNRRQTPAVPEPTGSFTHIPTMRTFDYAKRGFDIEIGKAMKAGNRAEAQALSEELNTLKAMLIEQNPKYGEILATQRDLFQQVRAVELGEQAMKRLRTDPRSLLRELRALPTKDRMNARIGIIDSLTAMDTKADPVGFFQSVYRNEAQRKVFEFAFGGKQQLASFNRWVTREAAGRNADVLVAPGRQSETSRVMLAADDEAGGLVSTMQNALRGYAFGGIPGAASGIMRTLQNVSHGTTKFAQDEIAKILMSKGNELPEQIAAVRDYMSRRAASNKRIATIMGKAGQQPFSTLVAGD